MKLRGGERRSSGLFARAGMIPLALVVVLLIGSVLIPASQSWRIMQKLRETRDVIEPLRLHVSQLQFGLVREAIALRALLVSEDGNGTIWRVAYRGGNR